MKSEKKPRKKYSPKPSSKKSKRHYRNDRSKKWHKSSSESSSTSEDSDDPQTYSSDESDDKKRSSRNRSRRSTLKREKRKHSSSSSASSPSPVKKKKHIRKTRESSTVESSEDESKVRKKNNNQRSKNKNKNSREEIFAKKKDDKKKTIKDRSGTESISPPRESHKHSSCGKQSSKHVADGSLAPQKSKIPLTKQSRSPQRTKISPSKLKQSQSKSPKSKRSRSKSPKSKKNKASANTIDHQTQDSSKENNSISKRINSKDPVERPKSPKRKRARSKSKDRTVKSGASKDRNTVKSPSCAKEEKKVTEVTTEHKKDQQEQNSPDSRKVIADIEEEMRKRKERIESWRKARNKENVDVKQVVEDEKHDDDKKWTLDDDDEEEEDTKTVEVKKEDPKSKPIILKKASFVTKIVAKKTVAVDDGDKEEEEDPLDAYMKTINNQVVKPKAMLNGSKTVTVVNTVVKKSVKAKPELIEQNQDALEYSSEEEGRGDVTAADFDDVRKKKKELAVADHSKIYYAQFCSKFYVEVPELSRMTSDQVKLYREELGDIQVRGKNIPKPIKTWSQAGVSSKVLAVLKKAEYEKPTPIQAQALPVIMSGRDMIGIAKTGSGKTLAFLLPMFRHVLDQPPLEEGDGPIAIIISPTRELALQIYRETKKFCKPLKISVVCIYGGSGISEQIAELKKGAEVIVCTPGRMIDMLTANNGKVTNCRRCTYLVMDEADRMFDMGFEPQVTRIVDNIRPNRQTVLFSATFPRQMEAVARRVLAKPIEVQVGGRSVVCSDVEQHALVIEEDNKFFKLLELLGVYQEQGSVLVFVEKQEAADALFKDLLKKSYPCLSLHGGMDQFDRDSTIADFKNGVTRLMVATSVAARGLDVRNLVLVCNYDSPNHYEDYVHRVGRTGRAGKKGTSFTFLTPEQGRNANDVIKAFELAKCDPPADVVALWSKFKEEMESAGKKVKSNCGFSGKGFKFNADEQTQINDAKKKQKFSLGLQDSDDEAEAAESAMVKIEEDLEKAFSNKPKIALAPEVLEAQKAKAAEQNVDKGKLKQASHIAALINKKLHSGQVSDRNTMATAHILHGGSLESLKGAGLAKQLADKVNAKLNYKAVEQEKTEETTQSNIRFEDEIDINDFPQQARWRITSKEIIEQVRELSESGVTVRGVYIPANKKPEPDEKRLHLYLESLSERSIQIAKSEIKRLLREELIRAESHSYKPQHQTGRYKVV